MKLFDHIVKLIVKEKQFLLLSRSEQKRLSVTIYLGILWAVILIFYTITDLSSGVYYALPAYATFFISSPLAYFFIRTQKYLSAKIVLFISGTLIVFYASITDPLESGASFLFIPIAMCSFAMLDYEKIEKIFLLNSLVFIFFLISFFELVHINVPTPSDDYIRTSFAINFLISLITSTLILYFLIKLSYQSEKELIGKEQSVLIKNKELEKINKELDRFVYSVSHDLRSPLSSILGIVNLAKYTDKNDELKEYLHLIEGRIKAQDDFIKNITDYSRNVRVEISKEKIEVLALVKEVIDSLRFLPGAVSIQFYFSIEEDITIISDKLRLRIILNNLISNAIKYSDALQKKAFIEIGASQLEEEVIIYVKDNGIGISSEWLPKIFDMFMRATEHSTGSGLGLFITKESVEKIGGTMSVESKTGQGSTFSIYLPNKFNVIT